jgi:hypothetical protein
MEVLCVSRFTVSSETGKLKTYVNTKVCANFGNDPTETQESLLKCVVKKALNKEQLF